jgi:RNase P/RNase MRP subunit p29
MAISPTRYLTNIAAEMRTSLRVAVCALLLAPFATEAQQLDSLRLGILAREVGSEVRVSTPSESGIHGRLLEVTTDMLRIDQATGPRTVPFSSRDTLWVRERLGWTPAGYGAVAGLAGAGGILLLFSSICGSGDDPCTGLGHAVLVLGVWGRCIWSRCRTRRRRIDPQLGEKDSLIETARSENTVTSEFNAVAVCSDGGAVLAGEVGR